MNTFIATWNGTEIVLSPVAHDLASKVIRKGVCQNRRCVSGIYAPPERTTIVVVRGTTLVVFTAYNKHLH